jgi:hypothetical protein
MFGFGATKNDARSQSTSSGDSLSVSNSVSNDLSSSISRAGGSSSSFQDVAFGDLFSQLYGGAAGAAGKLAGAVPDFGAQVGSLFSGGLNTLNTLKDYTDSRLNGPGVVDEQIGALSSDLGDFYNTQINPALRLGAEVNGTGGAGGRLGVAQGVAAGQLGKQLVSGAAQLRAADQQQRDQLALGSSSLSLDALPGLTGLAQTSASAPLLPYQLLSQIMGGPTVLGGSESSNFANADAYSIAQAIASSFGASHDESQSTSSSKQRGLNFGI